MPIDYSAFRTDLEILPQRRGQKPTGTYLIRDPAAHEIFEMREEEYFLCQQLDAQTSLTTIRARFESRFGTPIYRILSAGLVCQLLLFSVGVCGSLLTLEESNAHYFWTALWSTAFLGVVHNSNIAHRRECILS